MKQGRWALRVRASFGLAGTCRDILLQCSWRLHEECREKILLFCHQTVDCCSWVAEGMEDENFVPAYACNYGYPHYAHPYRSVACSWGTTLGSYLWMVGMVITVSLLHKRVLGLKANQSSKQTESALSTTKAPTYCKQALRAREVLRCGFLVNEIWMRFDSDVLSVRARYPYHTLVWWSWWKREPTAHKEEADWRIFWEVW